jgi:hypothetical protein
MNRTALFAFILISGFAFSQDAADKKIQAGLGFSTGLNLNKADTKKMATNGVGGDFSIGLNLNYNFSNTIGLFIGVDVDFENNKIKPNGEASSSYYYYDDTRIMSKDDDLATGQLFQWTERKQKANYLTIPTMLLFRTKFFGDLRFFGKFGLRTSFLLSNKIEDIGKNFTNNDFLLPEVETTNSGMKASADMSAIRSSIGMALGTEWNFSGPTSLSVEIGYYYGFTPIYRENDILKFESKRTLFFNGPTGSTYYSNAMTQSQLQLKVAVLF